MNGVTRVIGQRIRELRNQNNLTQEALSEGIISRTYLSLIEKGSVEPSNNVLIRLSERLGVSVSDLMEEVTASLRDPITVRREIVFNENKLSRQETTNIGNFIEETETFVGELDYLDQGRTYLIYARYYYLREEYKNALKYIKLSYASLKEIPINMYYFDSVILYAKLHLLENNIDAALNLLEPLFLEVVIDKTYTLYHRDILEEFIVAYFLKSSYFTVTRLQKQLSEFSLEHGLAISERVKYMTMISLYETRNFDTLKEVLIQNNDAVSKLLSVYCLLDEGNVKRAHESFKILDSNDYQNEQLEPIYKELKERLGSL